MWKGIWKMEVALFCFLVHRSNPNLTDWTPRFNDFHDFWICGTPGSPYLWIWIYQITQKNLRNPNYFWKYSFWNVPSGTLKSLKFGSLKILEFQMFVFFWIPKQNCWKARVPKIPTIRLINSWTSWILDQYLPWNMKWKFGNLGILELWNF